MPARFRERLGAGFFLTIVDPDKCLALYPTATWKELCDKLENAPRKDAVYRTFMRRLLASTEEAACDAQGRLLIVPALRRYAGIDKDVVSIGALNRVEIWARDRYLDQASPDAAEIEDFATQLGLY